MYSDTQFIEIVKSRHAKRKIYSLFFFLVACGLFIYLHYFVSPKESAISNLLSLEYTLVEGNTLTENEASSIKSILRNSNIIFLNYGLVLGAAYFTVINILAYSVYLFFGSRKDRLLIKLHAGENA